MGILSWIVFGLIAGIIAKLLMPGRDPGGCVITMLLGVAGAFVGGFLYRFVTGTEVLYFGFDLTAGFSEHDPHCMMHVCDLDERLA